MPPTPTTEEIASLYGLDAVPESVRRLTQLVSRQDTPLDEVAKILRQDKHVTARLLRAANPRAANEDEYNFTTVEAALQRLGMGCALVLAMSDPLMRAVLKTFHTMLSIELSTPSLRDMNPLEEEHVLGEVRFAGKAVGLAHIRMNSDAAAVVASRLLGIPVDELGEAGAVEDAVGELANIIVGNFQSNLCDAGLECQLRPPLLTRTSDFKLRPVAGGLAERMGFRAPELDLFADLIVDPWSG